MAWKLFKPTKADRKHEARRSMSQPLNYIHIGDFTVYETTNPGYFLIYHVSGEGGEFKATDLHKAIIDFYNKHF